MADSEIKTITLGTGSGIPEGTKLATPAGMPDLVVKTIGPIRRTAIRMARVYVQALVGFLPLTLGAGQAIANTIAPGEMVLPKEFGVQLLLAASLALAPSVVTLLGNLLEVLVKWDSDAV